MQITGIRRDIKELKEAIEKKPKDNSFIKSLTDEELLCAINQELHKLGFKQTFNSLDDIPDDLLQKIENGEWE
jgi:hypothetical protein